MKAIFKITLAAGTAAAAMDVCKGQTWDTTVLANYPVWGTWMFGRADTCDWMEALTAFHKIGGKAVLMFGPSFEKIPDTTSNPSHAAMTDCIDQGQGCFTKAKSDLQALNPGSTVVNYIIYQAGNWYGNQVMKCPAYDKKIVVTLGSGVKRTYWRIVLPHTSAFTCPQNGGTYDVLFTYFDGADSTRDQTDMVTRCAAYTGMEAWPGMPSIPNFPNASWQVDQSLLPAFYEWSDRVLSDWNTRFGSRPSFKGVYQAFEYVFDTSAYWLNVYDVEGFTSSIVHSKLPGKKVFNSPYWVYNQQTGPGQTLAMIKAAYKKVARKGVDIIAPQDGRGAGLAAYYWPYQASDQISTVDYRLSVYPSVAPGATFATQFSGSIDDGMAALRDATEELKTENVFTELWSNLEAFESGTRTDGQPEPYCLVWFQPFARTNKQRLDWALTHQGAKPTRFISYMWDSYYYCTSTAVPATLADEIQSDATRPIASEAFPFGGGIIIRGYNVAAPGTQFECTWYDSTWNLHTAVVSMDWWNMGWGALNNRSLLLQEAHIPFSMSNMAPNFYVHIRPQTSAGVQAYFQHSMKY